jgi:murein DD-endopeptidase MepM/ murein hydrolase activator NlpD
MVRGDMIWQARSLAKRWLAAIGNQLRVRRLPERSWSLTATAAGAAFLLSFWLTITSVSYFGTHQLLSEAHERIRALEQASAEQATEARLLANAFLEQIQFLERRAAQQQATIAELTGTNAALQQRLATHERQLASVGEQRNRARGLVGEMQQAIAGAEDLLGEVAEERLALQRRLAAAQDRLGEVSGQRDASRLVEVGLRWQLAGLAHETERLRSERDGAPGWLQDWVLRSVEALEQRLGETGVDVAELAARAGDASAAGQGGPLQVVAPEEAFALSAEDDPISRKIQRLATLQRIARALPLASPLDQFHVTSPYGKRRDPFTASWAFHPGVDLGAPRQTRVLATAPGQVVFAGSSGPYGNVVEIDHGMGILTRYAHLGAVEVARGDEVEFRHPLGMVGNTGRSTSRHLHYEIRIDDKAFDPASFLAAGRLIIGGFDPPITEAAR